MMKSLFSFPIWLIVTYWMINFSNSTCVQHQGSTSNELIGEYINACQQLRVLCNLLPGVYQNAQYACLDIDVNGNGVPDSCGCVNNTILNENLAIVVDMAYEPTQNFALGMLSAYVNNIYMHISNRQRISVEYIFVGGQGLTYTFNGASSYTQLTTGQMQNLVSNQGSLCAGVTQAINDLLQTTQQQPNIRVSNNILILNFSPLGDANICQQYPPNSFQATNIHTYAVNFFEANNLDVMETTLGNFDQCAGVVTADATASGTTFDNMNPNDKNTDAAQIVASSSDFFCAFNNIESSGALQTPSPTMRTPTMFPSTTQTMFPSATPTNPLPTRQPTSPPTVSLPTNRPTLIPTRFISNAPTTTTIPTNLPTRKPSQKPTVRPTETTSAGGIIRIPPKRIHRQDSDEDISTDEFYNHRDSADSMSSDSDSSSSSSSADGRARVWK
jgi:hypothetical protein